MNNSHNVEENPFLKPSPEPAFGESEPDSGLRSSQWPAKEKVPEHTEIDLAQVASRQAQLEGMVEETNQAVHTINNY